jgi:hypothetical protein
LFTTNLLFEKKFGKKNASTLVILIEMERKRSLSEKIAKNDIEIATEEIQRCGSILSKLFN